MTLRNTGKGKLAFLLVLSLLVASAAPALATVRIKGTVQVWNGAKNQYEPLRHARVRLVLAEDFDNDTLDKEGRTNSNGEYSVSKGNAWWRSGYKTDLIVFAESSSNLEIQNGYPQVDGYQAWSSRKFSRDDRTTTINLKIGGNQSNVAKWRVGGIASLDNSDATNATNGERAFFIYQEMTDHRLRLQGKALSGGDFKEKEVKYPSDAKDVADYIGVLDFIRFPQSYFSNDLKRASLAARHEMSHGIMSDAYWTWPGIFHGMMGSHTLSTVADHREHAWSEAWAEFMAEVTQQPRFGSIWNDFESQDAGWRNNIPDNADRSRVEGEIASALWDIYDGTGWEKRFEQEDAIPGEERFYDGLSDSTLYKIWQIFEEHHPHSLTHEEWLGGEDSFVWYWLNEMNYGRKHELKAILYNRGIQAPELAQSRPTVNVGTITYDGTTAKIPITAEEPNSEDREQVYVELYLNGTRVQNRRLGSGWNGGTNSHTLSHPIYWRQGQDKPEIIVSVHDHMQSSSVSRTLNPPAAAPIEKLRADLLGVTIRNFREVRFFLSRTDPPLRNAFLNVRTSDGRGTSTARLPATGTWNVNPNSEFRPSISDPVKLFETENIGRYIDLRFMFEGESVLPIPPHDSVIAVPLRVF